MRKNISHIKAKYLRKFNMMARSLIDLRGKAACEALEIVG